jgi:hypothetical protein
MRKRWILGVVGVLALFLAGCGGGDDVVVVSGPGLVGIDDTTSDTAPLLTVTYTVPPDPTQFTAQILSDLPSDGDIAYDPVLRSYFVTQSPPTVWFGIDSLDSHLPEYRAFFTFPLDGITGQPTVPGNAFIVSADVEVFINFLDFASAVPTFLDMVEYPFGDLGGIDPAFDFSQSPLAARSPFDFFLGDVGNFVRIEVTSMMRQAQILSLVDFQVRFSRDMSVPPLAPSAPSRPSSGIGRKVVPGPRAMEGIAPRRSSAAASPNSPADMAARRR